MSSSDWVNKDYYKTLGVSKDASEDEIRKAFRKIARDNHPDRNPGDKKAEQRFKDASEANDVLSDAKKRREYDQQRAMFGGGGGFHFPGGGQQMGGDQYFRMQSGDFGDLFSGLFNQSNVRRSSSRGPRRGADAEGAVTIGFEEAVNGVTVSLTLSSEEACEACRGTGAKAGTQPRVCPTCQGSGMESGGALGFAHACPDCSGRGLIIDDPCAVCYGSGRARGTRNVQVRLPAGVSDGQRVIIKDKGAAGENGGERGDLYVLVNVRPHPVFGRDGDNLTVTVPVTFAEAALGAEIEVPTLGAEPVKLRLPAGTPNGRTMRVRGRGVKRAKHEPGDLMATIEVQVPQTLSADARQALQEFDAKVHQPNPREKLLSQAKR